MFPSVVSKIIAEYSAEYILCEPLAQLIKSRGISDGEESTHGMIDIFLWFLHNPKGYLSRNTHPAAVNYLLQNTEHINYAHLSKNTNDAAINYIFSLESKPRISFIQSNENPRVVEYILNSNMKCQWISENPHPKIVKFLENEIQNGEYRYVSWAFLAANKNPDATRLLISEVEKGKASIDWWRLSENPNPVAVELVMERIRKEPTMLTWNWINLLRNSNPQIIELIKQKSTRYTDRELSTLAGNSGAVELVCEYLLANPHRAIPFDELSANPAIFTDTFAEVYARLES